MKSRSDPFPQRANLPSNLQNPGSTIDTSTWGTPSAAWPSTTCNTTAFFTSQKVCLRGRVFIFHTHGSSQLVLDITLCGDWAGVASVYNATCSGGTTGVCVSFLMFSANGELKRFVRSTPTTLSAQVAPATTPPTSRSTTFACIPSMVSLHPSQVLCIAPAPVARPSQQAPAPRADRMLVLSSASHPLPTCLSCCASALSSF